MEDIKSLDFSQLKEKLGKYTPFLAEVRKRIIFTICVFCVSTILGFLFYDKIIRFLIEILSLEGINIVFTSPFQFINLAVSCGFATGIIISFPLLIAQILFFLKPALREKEYKMIVGFLPLALILFLIGFSFGAVIMKWQIEIFLSKSLELGIGNILDISRLLETVIITSALMGVSFEFPILMLLLLRVGLIKHKDLIKARSWIYLGSFLFAILLPPDSVIADIFLAMPLVVLFELTLFINNSRERKLQSNN